MSGLVVWLLVVSGWLLLCWLLVAVSVSVLLLLYVGVGVAGVTCVGVVVILVDDFVLVPVVCGFVSSSVLFIWLCV